MSQQHHKQVSATNPFGRRTAGKREWKMTIYELLESEQESMDLLDEIGNKAASDAEVQRLVRRAMREGARRVIKLNQLLGYRDDTGEFAAEANGEK